MTWAIHSSKNNEFISSSFQLKWDFGNIFINKKWIYFKFISIETILEMHSWVHFMFISIERRMEIHETEILNSIVFNSFQVHFNWNTIWSPFTEKQSVLGKPPKKTSMSHCFQNGFEYLRLFGNPQDCTQTHEARTPSAQILSQQSGWCVCMSRQITASVHTKITEIMHTHTYTHRQTDRDKNACIKTGTAHVADGSQKNVFCNNQIKLHIQILKLQIPKCHILIKRHASYFKKRSIIQPKSCNKTQIQSIKLSLLTESDEDILNSVRLKMLLF
jgi:hypothetical protein